MLEGVHDGLDAWREIQRRRSDKSEAAACPLKPVRGRMWIVQAVRDGEVVWSGFFDRRRKALALWGAIESRRVPFSVRHSCCPSFDDWLLLDERVIYQLQGTQALTATSSSVQTLTVDATWNSANNKIEVIAPGGNGAARQLSTIGGCGGGAGEYSKRSNVALTAGGSMYYLLPAGGSVVDAWANDTNLLTATDSIAANWSRGNTTLTANATTAPDGTNTAVQVQNTLASSSTVNFWRPSSSWGSPGWISAQIYTCSIYAKPGLTNYISLTLQSDSTGNLFATQVFDLANGVLGESKTGTTSGTLVSATISTDSLATGRTGNGWYRCTIVASIVAATVVDFTMNVPPAATGNTFDTFGDPLTTGAANTFGVYVWGPSVTLGTQLKSYAVNSATSAVGVYSNLSKAGTNATTTAAGVHQTGGQGDTVNEGGDGFKPGTGVAIGGGGGGAAGPSGPGTTSTGSTGGAADNGTVTQPTATNANGVAGTEFGTQGSGTGASGRSGNGGGFTGGLYGGGGSGTGTQASQIGGTGAQAIIFLTWAQILSQGLTASQAQSARAIKGAKKIVAGSESSTATIVSSGGHTPTAKILSATAAQAVTMTRAAGKVVSSSQAEAATVTRAAAKILVATGGETARIARTALRVLSAASGEAATITRVRTLGKAITAAQPQASSFVRNSSKTLSAALAEAARIIRGASRTLSASGAQQATIARSSGKVISAADTQTAAITRAAAKRLSASQPQTTNVARAAAKALSAAEPQSATITRLKVRVFGMLSAQAQVATMARQATRVMLLAALQGQQATVVRVAAKILSAAQTASASLAKMSQRSLGASQAEHATLSPSSSRTLRAQQPEEATISRTAGKTLSTGSGQAASLAKAVARTLSAAAGQVGTVLAQKFTERLLSASQGQSATSGWSASRTLAAVMAQRVTIALTSTSKLGRKFITVAAGSRARIVAGAAAQRVVGIFGGRGIPGAKR